MTTTFQIIKRGLLAGTLLIVGFGAGWVSALALGGRIPLDGDISAYLGPGMGANRATPSELRDQFAVFWEVWNLVESEFYHRAPLDRQHMIQGAIKGMLDSVLGLSGARPSCADPRSYAGQARWDRHLPAD
jgi:carboxyl-terminal processing protease